jgi:hypothetical protein
MHTARTVFHKFTGTNGMAGAIPFWPPSPWLLRNLRLLASLQTDMVI